MTDPKAIAVVARIPLGGRDVCVHLLDDGRRIVSEDDMEYVLDYAARGPREEVRAFNEKFKAALRSEDN